MRPNQPTTEANSPKPSDQQPQLLVDSVGEVLIPLIMDNGNRPLPTPPAKPR